MRFGGRTAFITGAAIGFGRAFARALDEGASVAIVDSTSTWPNALLPNWFGRWAGDRGGLCSERDDGGCGSIGST